MTIPEQISPERRHRNPLITPAGHRRLRALLDHPDAPEWNYEVGDRLQADDLPAVNTFRQDVFARREPGTGRPPSSILNWVAARRSRVPLFQDRIPEGFDLERDWAYLPTLSRQDLALHIESVVPLDADIARLIVYDTSGVTGHAIRVPHHPRAMAQNHPMLEFALAQHGVRLEFSADTVACINIGAQLDTVVFATVFSVWNQSGFAKVNLHRRRWTPEQAQRFFRDQHPQFLTGDPVGFAEMAAWKIDTQPAAMLSTAVTLSAGLKTHLEERYRCPVIDTYASTETGLIAYANREGDGLSILPHDIYVEIVDPDGMPVAEGERGEICVTGGRNPYVALLRYRTGDFARMVWSNTVPSDPAPRLLDLAARDAVSFSASDGTVISPVDIGRVIREWAIVQNEFVQHADGACTLRVRAAPGCPIDTTDMQQRLQALFGTAFPVTVQTDDTLGTNTTHGKVIPFRSDFRPHTGTAPSEP